MTTPKPQKNASSEPVVQKQKRSREEEKSAPCFLSNNGYLWVDMNPDVTIIEPRILVSVNYNYLAFHRKETRPPESRSLTLINHGDYPIAFKVETTDNISYFVDRKSGIIPPKQTIVNAAVRMPNTTTIEVYHRPHNEYTQHDEDELYNRPRKDKMTILLAPQMCQTFAPEAIFHNERSYEKLRIVLGYLGTLETGVDKRVKKQLLLHGIPGWATWKEEKNGARQKKNEKQIDDFHKIEKIIQNASREQCEDNPKPVPILRQSPAVFRSRTPMGPLVGRRRPGMQKQFRSISPFNRTPTIKKTQSVTPRKMSNEPPTPTRVTTHMKTSLENQKTPVIKKNSVETPKKSNEIPTPAVQTPRNRSFENDKPPSLKMPPKAVSPKQNSKKKSLENDCPPSPTLLKNTKAPTPRKEVLSPKAERKSQEHAAPPHPISPPPKQRGSGEPHSPKPDANSPSTTTIPDAQ